MAQLLTLEELKNIRPQLTEVVLAGGVFDILHIGHVNHLKEAKNAGKTLIVHVTGDARVKAKKGSARPYQPEAERAGIIAGLESPDYVFIENVPHYDKHILDTLQPDKIFFNAEALSPDIRTYLKELGMTEKIVISHREKKHHTSNIVKKIQANR